MSELKIGMYEQDITPDEPVDLPGQFYRRISEYVETPLSANIVACESDGEQMIIVACDQTTIKKELMQTVRELVSEKNDEIDTSKIIIAATHLHTAPDYQITKSISSTIAEKYLPEGCRYVRLKEDVECMDPVKYYNILAESIANGIIKAWEGRRKAYISQGFGRAVVGHSRRVAYSDGSAKMYGIADKPNFQELESGNDTGVELLYVFDQDKKPMGVLVNVACPAQILEHCSFVSSDYWGKTRQMVKESLGADFVTVGLCSAAGCQSPRDMIRFILPDTMDPNLRRDNIQKPRMTDPDMYAIEGTVEIGERVSSVILSQLKKAKECMTDTAVLKHVVEEYQLPLRKVSEKDRENALEEFAKYFERAKKTEYDAYDMAALYIHAGVLDRYTRQEREQFFPIELHVARLGNVAFASNPFELFLDYGNKIRARSDAQQTFLIQLACDRGGYLPTEKAEKGSHYSAYVASGNVGHEGGELLVNKTLNVIQDLFKD